LTKYPLWGIGHFSFRHEPSAGKASDNTHWGICQSLKGLMIARRISKGAPEKNKRIITTQK
jgi:hypothetical protein